MSGNEPYDDDVEAGAGESGNFERQDLLDMVHEKRGVVPGAEPEAQTPKRQTRITHHEIKAMKVSVRKESSPIVGLFRNIGGLFSGIFSMLGSFIPGTSKKVNPCKVNGHVFPAKWQGDFPKCNHCGTVIKHPGQIKPKRDD